MRTLFRTVLAVTSVVVLVACGTNAEPYAAKVNDSKIETKSLDRELNAIASNKEYLAALQKASVPVQGAGKGCEIGLRSYQRQCKLRCRHMP